MTRMVRARARSSQEGGDIIVITKAWMGEERQAFTASAATPLVSVSVRARHARIQWWALASPMRTISASASLRLCGSTEVEG